MLEDRLLIFRFNLGDTRAFKRVYEKYRTEMLKVAVTLLNDVQAAEDILHDVFVAFARQSGHFQLKGSLKGYLAICVANRARDWNRSQGRRQCCSVDEYGAALEVTSNQDNPLLMRERVVVLERALAGLPVEQREVVVLHGMYRLPFKEISQQQGLSINTVMSRYRYGLDKLRSQLNGEL